MRLMIGVLAAALLGSGPAAGDEAQWQVAVGKIAQARQKKDRDPETFRKAILEIGDATYDKRDKDTVNILLDILITELKDDSIDGRREDRIDGRILEGCETSLKKVRSKAAIESLVTQVRNGRFNIRARFIICRVLGIHQGDAITALLEVADDRDVRLQIGAVDGLAEHVRETVGTKVEAADRLAAEASTQAETLKTAAVKYLEEKPAALAKLQCEAIAFQMDLYVSGQGGRDPATKAIELLKGIASAIEKPEIKKEIEPLVGGVEGAVAKVFTAADAVSVARVQAAPVLARLLKIAGDSKRSWETRVGAVAALRPDRNFAHAEALIEALANCGPEDGRLKVDLMTYLGAILGVKDPKSDDANFWKGALAERKAGKRPGESGGTTVVPTEFFGLKTKSTRIVFILDRTGSMDFKLTETSRPKKDDPPPKGPDTTTGGDEKPSAADEAARKAADDLKKKWDDRKVEKRMDALKKEFINTVYRLDPRVMFAVITYEGSPTNWRPAMVQATWANKMECIKDIDRMSASGPTNVWDGLENAFRFVAEPKRPDIVQFDKKGNYIHHTNGADTFFLMTDGNHNTGRFSTGGPPPGDFDEHAFFSEFRKINATRKVVVNTIILGDTSGKDNPDPIKQKSLSLFRRIAEESGGTFVHWGK